MTRKRLGEKTDKVLAWLQVALVFVISAVGGLIKVNIRDLPQYLEGFKAFFEVSQRHAWWMVIAGPLLVAAIQMVRKRHGQPWAWKTIEKLLHEYRKELFPSVPNEPDDYHRVTLFRRELNLLRIGWPRYELVAVARSGHLTHQKATRFPISDDPAKCLGVAGHAWRCSDWVTVPENGRPLPSLERSSPLPKVQQYAKRTFSSTDWVKTALKNNKPLALSYAAVRITIGGKNWGVLVIDSRYPKEFKQAELDRFKPFGTVMTPLLERVHE